MTFISSLVGAASTAVDRLSGRPGSGLESEIGKFASILATVASTGTRSSAAGRNRELRLAEEVEDTRRARDHQDVRREDLVGASSASARLDAARETAGDRVEPTESEAVEEVGSEATEATEDAEAAAAGSIPAADVRSVNRNLDSLAPELRQRLERVMARMKEEFGHAVTVVEAQRSQERQNFLYEQGRSRPGNVVTWTRDSNHLTGRAVDVMIDGSYNNALGYQRLARIAAEEGLRTLGARDPGHVELPNGVDDGGPAPQAGVLAALPTLAVPTAGQGADQAGLARVAEVARVAEIATVAQVADVARVADPTRPAPTASTSDASAAASLLAAQGGSQGGSSGGASGNGSGGQQNGDSQLTSAIESELLRGDPSLGRVFSLNSSFETAGVGGTDAVQRAAQILALKEGASAAPVNHLLLRVDNAAGGEDRIRVDLRGGIVGTTLNIENSGEAERLAARVGELRQSLERRGLEAEAVRIRTTPVSTERVELSRSVLPVADLDSARSGSSRPNTDSTQREGWKESQGQQLRRDSGDSRQRSRKEQPNEDKA